MDKKKKIEKDVANQAGALVGNAMSVNIQSGSNMAMESMGELLYKSGRISNVGFEQSKGNLLEYIEAAKLQTKMANNGKVFDKNPVTDIPKARGGFGENTAPDDFRFQKDGHVIGRGQAKYNNNPRDAARNFSNTKYTDMQRIAPVNQMNDIKKCLDKMLEDGEISKDAYHNAVNNLQHNGLTDPSSGISSGGTTTDELQKLRGADGKLSKEAVKKYANAFERKQYRKEIGNTTVNMAAASAITNGLVSGAKNMFEVLQNRKELDQALKEIGADTAKGAARGAGTGFLSSIFRIGGTKSKVPIIADSTTATVMAGAVIDGGVAIYSYARGEISSDELSKELVATTVKSTATIYFTKAIGAVVSTANPFVPMAIYTAASYVVSCTRAIIEQSHLNAQEYNRMADLLEESTKMVREYHEKMNAYLKYYEENQRRTLQGFMNSFEYNVESGEHYEMAIYSIVNFANQTGIALKHANFEEFRSAMMSKDDFVLR